MIKTRGSRRFCGVSILSGAVTATVSLVVTASLHAHASTSASGYPSYMRSSRIVEGGPRTGTPFSVDRLIELVESGEARTIESAIAVLPQELRNNYVLMYRSRSLQKATFQAPRALLFERDGRFVVSFNGGDPKMRGHDKLETVQFREETKRWEFREIDFSNPAGPRVSEVNPRKCLECHQSARRRDVDPRPNWEPYSNWPGAYAGVDGKLGGTLADSYSDRMKLRPEDAPLVAEQRLEVENMRAFEADVKPQHPRYRQLGAFQPRGSLDLTDLLVGTNALRVARLASETPDWPVYRNLTLESVFCFLGPNESPVASWPRELRAAHGPELATVVAEFNQGENVARRMTMLFDTRGIDTSDWSMDFKTRGRFAFADRFGSPSNPASQLRNGFVEALGIPSVTACTDARRGVELETPRLRESGELAVAAARAHAARTQTPPTQEPTTLLMRCARCHSGPDPDGPVLPFDDLSALRQGLGRGGFPRGTLLDEIIYRLSDFATNEEQMPPAGPPTPLERTRLIEWLRGS